MSRRLHALAVPLCVLVTLTEVRVDAAPAADGRGPLPASCSCSCACGGTPASVSAAPDPAAHTLARAEPPRPRKRLQLRVDFLTPNHKDDFGGALALVYAPAPAFELELGGGMSLSGPRVSLLPRVSLGSERHRFLAGFGATLGLRDARADSYGGWPEPTRRALLATVAIGYEYRRPSGWSFYVALNADVVTWSSGPVFVDSGIADARSLDLLSVGTVSLCRT